jgi:hypothetical protein
VGRNKVGKHDPLDQKYRSEVEYLENREESQKEVKHPSYNGELQSGSG